MARVSDFMRHKPSEGQVQLANDLIADTEAKMKATYQVQGLPEVSKSFRLVQSNAKDELFEVLGFCNPRSTVSLSRRQGENRNEVNENSIMSADSWPLIRKEWL
jgi:hypothetical protein